MQLRTLTVLSILAGTPAVLAAQQPERRSLAQVLADAPAEAWRPLDAENTVYLELDSGVVVIELAPRFAPRHVENIRTLVRAGAFDGGGVVRSQDNYVAQWTIAADLAPRDETADAAPDLGGAEAALPAEFEVSTEGLPFTPIPDGDIYAPEAGFTLGFPVGRDPEAGTTWLAHCYGVVGVARGTDPNSGNGSSLYAVTGHAPRHLDRNLTMAGRVVSGMELLSSLPRGSGGLGFYELPETPVPIRGARIGSDVPEDERLAVLVLRTDSETFREVIEARRYRTEDFFVYPVGRVELCNVPVPTRPIEGA
ncbi:MAG TPA: peptidylprolyl isomerase [Longimicrobiales bacterium]|nr:peptidylprolyl isomerase [Longimicrobiales bacterium]